jgi:hypothetical protein
MVYLSPLRLRDARKVAIGRDLVSDGGDRHFAAIEINEFPFPLNK